MSVIKVLFWLIFLGWALVKVRKVIPQRLFLGLLCVKLAITMAAYWYFFVLTHDYLPDSVRYWQMSEAVFAYWKSHLYLTFDIDAVVFFFPELLNERVRVFVFILSALQFFLPNSVVLFMLVFSTIIFLLFLSLTQRIESSTKKWVFLIAFCLSPHVLFWSSGLLKEMVVFPALVVVFFLCFVSSGRFRLRDYVILGICLAIIGVLKYYILGLVVVFFGGYWFIHTFQSRLKVNQLLLIGIVFGVVLIVVAGFIHPNLTLTRFFMIIAENSQAGVLGNDITYTEWSFVGGIKNVFVALYSGLLRPFVWEVDSVFTFLASIYNVLLTSAILVYGFKKIQRKCISLSEVFLLGYGLVGLVLLTLSTPNLGTLDRYKLYVTPFVLYVCLNEFLSNKKKVANT